MTNFLLIEDDDVDYWAVQRAFKRLGVSSELTRVTDALEALDILSKRSNSEEYFQSLVILLDLNLPCMNGFDFLDRISLKPHLSEIPVIITSTSDADKDRELASEHQVTAYINKANLVSGLERALVSLNVPINTTEHNSATKASTMMWHGERETSTALECAFS